MRSPPGARMRCGPRSRSLRSVRRGWPAAPPYRSASRGPARMPCRAHARRWRSPSQRHTAPLPRAQPHRHAMHGRRRRIPPWPPAGHRSLGHAPLPFPARRRVPPRVQMAFAVHADAAVRPEGDGADSGLAAGRRGDNRRTGHHCHAMATRGTAQRRERFVQRLDSRLRQARQVVARQRELGKDQQPHAPAAAASAKRRWLPTFAAGPPGSELAWAAATRMATVLNARPRPGRRRASRAAAVPAWRLRCGAAPRAYALRNAAPVPAWCCSRGSGRSHPASPRAGRRWC